MIVNDCGGRGKCLGEVAAMYIRLGPAKGGGVVCTKLLYSRLTGPGTICWNAGANNK